jgi:hypothetical protein
MGNAAPCCSPRGECSKSIRGHEEESEMSDYDQEAIDAMARVLLEGCVELRKEASQLDRPEREQDELTKFVLLEQIRKGNAVYADAIRERLLELASANGEEFVAWLTDLFERSRRQA